MTGHDAQLLRRYAEEHAEDAFAEFVRIHLDAVYSAALRRVAGDTHLAEDVVQHVFTAVARNASLLAGHPAIGAWLYVTTRNEAANAVRAERRRKERERAMMDEPTAACGEVEWGQLAPVLDAAIDGLGERDRTAIVLRFMNRCRFAEIGTALGISEDAARMRVDRALEKLRERLVRRGVTSTAVALEAALTTNAVVAAPSTFAAGVAGAASAGGSAVTGWSVLQLMSSTKVIVAAAVAAAVAIGIATRDVLALQDAEARMDGVAAENRSLAGQLRSRQEKLARIEASVASAERALAEQGSRATLAPAGGNDTGLAAEEARRIAAGEAFMRRHPDVQRAYLENSRYFADLVLASWPEAASWSAEQRRQVAEYLMRQHELFSIPNLVDGTGRSFTLGPALDVAEQERALLPWLGEDGLARLRGVSGGYHQAVAARQFAIDIARELYLAAEPLRPEQATRLNGLVRTLAPADSWRGAYDIAPVLAEVRSILSPGQYAALEAVGVTQRFNLAYERAGREQTANGMPR